VLVALPVREGRLDFEPPPGDWTPVVEPELAQITVLERRS
jgi:hypothetical protein